MECNLLSMVTAYLIWYGRKLQILLHGESKKVNYSLYNARTAKIQFLCKYERKKER
jgi:hypothetical protein